MTHNSFRSKAVIRTLGVSLASLVFVCDLGYAQGPPPAPPFTSPDIKPTFFDWITAHPVALAKKIKLTDPLLKPPFAAAPPGSLKGLAAGIRAAQLDVPNRVKAVQYLGTVDCVAYPDAQKALIATMEEDPSEEVRYEAVMALRNMLTRGCCNMDTQCECQTCANRKQIVSETEAHARKGEKSLIKEAKGPAKKLAKQAHRDRETEAQRYDCCRGCANEKVMKALAKVASEKDDQCCWVEPSERVRAAAAEAMCLFKNYSNGYSLPEKGPEPLDDDEDKDKMKDGEVDPSDDSESEKEMKSDSDKDKPAPKPKAEASRRSPKAAKASPQVVERRAAPAVRNVPETNPAAPVIPGLKGRCIVAMKMRQVLPVDPQFSSVHEERTYYFSSAEAKATFDQDPKNFAPVYGGIDPVVWLAQRQMQDGQVLREFEGRFFLFANKDNWEAFKVNPDRYVLRSQETNLRTVGGSQ